MSYTHEEIEARLRAAAANLDSGFDRAGFVARAADESLVDVAWCRVDSPVGPLVVAGTGAGLLAVSFDEADAALGPIAEHVSSRILEMPDRLDPVRRQLDEYFAGRRHRFALSLDRRLSRGFRATVLRVLEAVDYGQTVSYAELAARAGNPQAFRAVGSAMATNPIPIVVPCHRVLRTGGGLGGYAGGLEVKRWLLELEGVGTPPA